MKPPHPRDPLPIPPLPIDPEDDNSGLPYQPDPEKDDKPACRKCGEVKFTRINFAVTPFCDDCAQEIAQAVLKSNLSPSIKSRLLGLMKQP